MHSFSHESSVITAAAVTILRFCRSDQNYLYLVRPVYIAYRNSSHGFVSICRFIMKEMSRFGSSRPIVEIIPHYIGIEAIAILEVQQQYVFGCLLAFDPRLWN